MKTLHLTLKTGWFDMIAAGDKKEEYREIKPYWETRLLHSPYVDINIPGLQADQIKKYEAIEFRNGYSKNARKMTVEWLGLSVGQPAFRWFGREEKGIIFIIHLGQILSKNFD